MRTLLSSAPDVVRPSSVVRDLCVVDIEAELTQQQHLHVNWLVRSAAAFPPRSTSAAEPAARQTSDSVSVISRLDYCNSVLAGLPAQYLRQMHRVQNAAARPILKLKPRDHITPALRELHWLFTREVESAIQALSADAPCHYGTLSCVPIYATLFSQLYQCIQSHAPSTLHKVHFNLGNIKRDVLAEEQ